MGVAVFVAITQLFHQLGRRVAQMQRHFKRAVFGGAAQCGLEAHIHRVAFWRTRQIGDGLGHRQLALRAAETFLHIPGRQAQAQRARVGVADVFAGHAHHPPGDIQRVAAAVDHSREPVQSTVRVGATHRLVQGRDLVVKGFATLVEAPLGIAQQVMQQVGADFAVILGQVRGVFQQVEQAPTITVSRPQQNLEAFIAQAQAALAQPLVFREGSLHQLVQGRLIEAFEHIDTRPRQQCVVQLKGRVFSGGTDKNQGAIFDIGQKCILLRLVEAMHFVNKQDGAAPVLARLLLGNFDRLTDLLDPGQYRRNGFKVCIRDFCQQPRQGGFTHARRPPENHRMQRALLQRFTQGLAASEQVFLTDVLIQIGCT